MKKTIVVLVLLFSTLVTFSQLTFALKGGVNSNFMERPFYQTGSEGIVFSSPTIGFNFGIQMHERLSEKWTFSPEIQYSQKGSRAIAVDTKQIMKIVSIPLLVNYEFNSKLALEVGPELGYLLSSTYKSNGEEYSNCDCNQTEVSLNLGMKVAISESSAFGIRYNHSVTPLLKDVPSEEYVLFPFGDRALRSIQANFIYTI